ncbi:MAG: SHD1 domain-containing protein [Planctomycetota bacterium]
MDQDDVMNVEIMPTNANQGLSFRLVFIRAAARFQTLASELGPVSRRSGDAIVLVLMLASCVGAQDFQSPRVWTDVSGRYKTNAVLADFDDETVTLKTATGKSTTLPLGKLSESDRGFLKASQTIKESRQQEKRLAQINASAPDTIVDLKQMIKEFPLGIPAKLRYAAKLAMSTRKTTEIGAARRSIGETVDGIKLLRKHWPNDHSVTLGAAYVNRAVICAREGNLSGVANHLALAKEVLTDAQNDPTKHRFDPKAGGQVISVCSHNARLFLNSQIDLEGVKGKFSDAAATGGRAVITHQPLLAYCMIWQNFGSPTDDEDGEAESSRSNFQWQDLDNDDSLLFDTCCLACGGGGRMDCPTCTNGYVQEKRIVVLGRDLNGNPIRGPKFFKVRCTRCDRQGNQRCRFCNGTGNAR